MVKQRSREDRLSLRGIEKDLPRPNLMDRFHGFSQDEVNRRCGLIPCRFCGQPLYPYKDFGVADISRCYSIGCPNNIDSPLRFDINELWKFPSNLDRVWADWKPRRIV